MSNCVTTATRSRGRRRIISAGGEYVDLSERPSRVASGRRGRQPLLRSLHHPLTPLHPRPLDNSATKLINYRLMDFTVIAHAVEVDHGIKCLSMRLIKKYAAPERERLSAALREQISKELDTQGLMTLPKTLPSSEKEFVFVIKKDSPLGQVVSVARVVAGMETLGMTSFPPGVLDNFPEALRHLT